MTACGLLATPIAIRCQQLMRVDAVTSDYAHRLAADKIRASEHPHTHKWRERGQLLDRCRQRAQLTRAAERYFVLVASRYRRA